MRFLKSELEFLKVFGACADTRTFDGDKLFIITKPELNRAYFGLFTDDVKMIQQIDCSVDDTFIMNINLVQFNSMLSFCKDDEFIEFNNGKIKFGETSEYDFETFDFNIQNFNDILNMPVEGNLFELKDISKIDQISFSIGADKEISCIAYQDNHFITYDSNILSFIKTDNNISENFYLPKIFYKLYQLYKFDTVNINKISEQFFYMSINNMKIFMDIAEYSIPYIFSDDIKSKFEHQNKIVLNTDLFKNKLSRLKVLTQKTMYNRVFIYLNESEIKAEIKDDYKGHEFIVTGIDKDLVGTYFICNTTSLHSVLNNYNQENITIKVSKDEMSVIKIEDEKNNINYVLTLYKKYEED
jgi:hypothetical protein